MSDFQVLDIFFMLGSHLSHNLIVILLQLFNLLFEVVHNFALLLHQLIFLISKSCFQVDDLLLKLSDTFLQLHLDKLFVTACVIFQLLDHALILFFELLHLSSMLLSQVSLKLFIFLLRLLLVFLKSFSCLLKLSAQCLRSLIATLHRLLELIL